MPCMYVDDLILPSFTTENNEPRYVAWPLTPVRVNASHFPSKRYDTSRLIAICGHPHYGMAH